MINAESVEKKDRDLLVQVFIIQKEKVVYVQNVGKNLRV
jgi:hypothetical protein